MNELQKEFQKRSITKAAVYYSYDDNQWTVQVIGEEFLEKHKGEITSVIDKVAGDMKMGKLDIFYRVIKSSS